MNTVERAFSIARSGSCASVEEIKQQMRQEGYATSLTEPHLAGPSIRKQLVGLMSEARRK